MNEYEIDNWIIGLLISIRKLAEKAERETIVDRLDEAILTVANDGHRPVVQDLQRAKSKFNPISKGTRSRH